MLSKLNHLNVDTFPDIYPDYIAVTVPVGIAPLNFTMKDDCERIDIRMQGVGGKELHMNDTDVDIEEWKQLLKASKGDSIIVTVSAKYDGKWKQYKPFPFYVRQLFYRLWIGI